LGRPEGHPTQRRLQTTADLTPLDEKLGEVLGLAQTAQAATKTVAGLEGAEQFRTDLDRMHEQAQETERRTDDLIDTLEGPQDRDPLRLAAEEAKEMVAG
jgi:hypothetical protein